MVGPVQTWDGLVALARHEWTQAFPDRCEGECLVARAPGRINILGEHTDYNEGFVLPAATVQATYVAALPREDGQVRVWSAAFRTREQFSVDGLEPLNGERQWGTYIRGVVWALKEIGIPIGGVDAAIIGDLPIGAGLASSAAVEIGFAQALLQCSETALDPTELALLCQRAENEFVGVKCGILDQFSSVFGSEGAALLIDCRSRGITAIDFGHQDAVFVVCDTRKPRGLVKSEYNTRRAQCERAAEQLGVTSLRDASLEVLLSHRDRLDPDTFRRAHHVVTENDRVMEGVEALRSGDCARLGRLLLDSHASLRDDYEVSCDELDAMVEIACEAPGCRGARLMGAGFGGCALALVDLDQVDRFCSQVTERYTSRCELQGRTFVTRPSQGAGCVG